MGLDKSPRSKHSNNSSVVEDRRADRVAHEWEDECEEDVYLVLYAMNFCL